MNSRFYCLSWGVFTIQPTYSLGFSLAILVERSNLLSKVSWYVSPHVVLLNEKVSHPRGLFLISGADLHMACAAAVTESKSALDQLEEYV